MFGINSKNVVVILLTVLLSAGAALAQNSAFTYQGKITDGGLPADGNYDLQFGLFDGTGNQIGQTQTIQSVPVSSGVFTVTLDFGANAFPGSGRSLGISARPVGATSFTLMSPRQPISSTPYAVRSLNTGTADVATNAQQLGGVAANQYVKTDDARLSNARPPATGSNDYIQNTNTAQGANFNIAGNGTVAGVFTGNMVNAGLQYTFQGQRMVGRIGANGILFGALNQPIQLGDNANIGIGTATPTTAIANGRSLDIVGPSAVLRLGAQVSNGKAWEWQSTVINGAGALNLSNVTDLTNPLTIAGNGAIGFGMTTPVNRFHMVDPGNTGLRVQTTTAGGTVASFGGSGDFSIDSKTSGPGARLLIKENGNIGVGTLLPTAKLDVNGITKTRSLGFGGNTQLCWNNSSEISVCSSSLRYKTDLHPFIGGLNVVNRLQPITFKWKSDETLDLGFGAEDVAAVEPLLVTRNERGEVEGVKYDRLSAVFINAFKEQQAQIATLRALNDSLTTRMRKIEKTLKRHSVARRRG